MALAPARLLLPVRAVEPPHSSAFSSASVCSAAGAYPQFSSFFFHPPNQRSSSFFVAASLLETQNNRAYKLSRYTQLRGPPHEAISFDDVQNPYAEGRSGHPSRSALKGRASSAPRFGRVDGNGGRRSWEPNHQQPWKRHGVSEGEAKARYNKPPSSQGNRNVSSWTSHNGQRMANRNRGRDGFEARDSDNNGFVSSGDSGDTPWQRQGNSYQRGASRFDNLGQGQPSDTFSPWKSSRNQRGASRFDNFRQGQPSDTFSSGGESSRNQDKRGKFNSPWGSSTGLLDEFEQHSDRNVMDIRHRSHSPNGILSLQPPVQSFYTTQSNVSDRRWHQEEVQTHQGEMADRVKEANLEFLGEQEDSSFSGSSPIARIMQRLRSVEDRIPPLRAREGLQPRSQSADVLALPSAREYLSDRSLPNLSGEQSEIGVADTKFPWEREDVEDSSIAKARKVRPQSPAELTIPGPELRRLRILAVHLKQRVKIGKHGVTRDLVSSIHKRFHTCEVVKVKCEGPPAGNMKMTLETLEEQTGGLIIWKSGSAAVLYRGQNYGQPVSEIVDDLLAKKYQSLMSADGSQEASLLASQNHAANEVGFLEDGNMDSFHGKEDATEQLNSGASLDDASENLVSDANLGYASKRAALKKRTTTSGPESEKLEEYTVEMDELLKDLGPRFEDWTGPKPVPVDADLLPSSIPNYSPPYRLLPFGMRPNMSNTKATHFRRLSRPLAPHFVIGRDRGLEGLAAAMVKLWENSEIAKIGVKRGVLNTSHEIIAEDLKQLTGGFFLCRDKYSLTFYRGNDFLPQTISAALADRQTRAENLQVEEERGRADGSVNIIKGAMSSGSQPSWVQIIDPEEQIRLKKEAARARRVQVIAHLGRKLKMALEKKQKAERELDKVEQLLKPVASSDDKEILTDEERFMLRKLGLKMKAFLLLGRRRVFSGVVQNMHLHWKHRELVKVVVKERDPAQLDEIARMLEAESGGTLISVDPTSKGFAIVVFRGKNYTRPPELRPPNLLTKRLALRRSLEMQRREALSRHMQGLEEEIVLLRAGLNKMKGLEHGDESVHSNDRNNAHNVLKVDDSHESHQNQEGSQTGIQALTENSAAHESLVKQGLFEDDDISSMPKISRRKLKNMCELGPIFKAVRLSKTERHAFRNEVLKMGKAPHCLVGRSNPMSAIAKAIRLHFLNHTFVKIGVSYRPRGTSVQDVVEDLEDLTGGTAYAQDDFRVILYRGWPSGEEMPLDGLYDVLSPEQCEILEDDEDEESEDDEEESMTVNTLTQAAGKIRGVEESDDDEDAEDEEWDSLSDEEDDEEWDNLSNGEGDEEEDELRSEVTSVRGFVSSDDEDVDRGLHWDKFSDSRAKNNHDDKDDSRWPQSWDASAVGADDPPTLPVGNAHADQNDNSDWGHEHVENSSVENQQSSGNSSFKEDAEVDIFMAGNMICKGAGAMALDFDAEEDGESFFIRENGSLTDSRSNYGSVLTGVSDGAGGDQMGLDFDLDEDV